MFPLKRPMRSIGSPLLLRHRMRLRQTHTNLDFAATSEHGVLGCSDSPWRHGPSFPLGVPFFFHWRSPSADSRCFGGLGTLNGRVYQSRSYPNVSPPLPLKVPICLYLQVHLPSIAPMLRATLRPSDISDRQRAGVVLGMSSHPTRASPRSRRTDARRSRGRPRRR